MNWDIPGIVSFKLAPLEPRSRFVCILAMNDDNFTDNRHATLDRRPDRRHPPRRFCFLEHLGHVHRRGNPRALGPFDAAVRRAGEVAGQGLGQHQQVQPGAALPGQGRGDQVGAPESRDTPRHGHRHAPVRLRDVGVQAADVRHARYGLGVRGWVWLLRWG